MAEKERGLWGRAAHAPCGARTPFIFPARPWQAFVFLPGFSYSKFLFYKQLYNTPLGMI